MNIMGYCKLLNIREYYHLPEWLVSGAKVWRDWDNYWDVFVGFRDDDNGTPMALAFYPDGGEIIAYPLFDFINHYRPKFDEYGQQEMYETEIPKNCKRVKGDIPND